MFFSDERALFFASINCINGFTVFKQPVASLINFNGGSGIGVTGYVCTCLPVLPEAVLTDGQWKLS